MLCNNNQINKWAEKFTKKPEKDGEEKIKYLENIYLIEDWWLKVYLKWKKVSTLQIVNKKRADKVLLLEMSHLWFSKEIQ